MSFYSYIYKAMKFKNKHSKIEEKRRTSGRYAWSVASALEKFHRHRVVFLEGQGDWEKMEGERVDVIARRATSDSFSRATEFQMTLLYKEKDRLMQRMPDGKEKTVRVLESSKPSLAARFKIR